MLLKIYWIIMTATYLTSIRSIFTRIIEKCSKQGISPTISTVIVGVMYSLAIPLYYTAFRYIFGV